MTAEIDELEQRLRTLSCTEVSDALDRFGINGQCAGIMPLDRSFRLLGRARTLSYGPVGTVVGTVGDFIDQMGPGDVVVLDNRGRTDCTIWGDLLTSTAARNKVAGTVIDGVCRDVDRSVTLGYPIFSRGNWVRTGKDRVQLEAVGEAVVIGGVRVQQGDWVLGDGDGLVVVPQEHAPKVVTAACEIRDAERRIREAVEAGNTLASARADVGYHRLQSAATEDANTERGM